MQQKQQLSDAGNVVEAIAKAIVDHPDRIVIHEDEGSHSSVITIETHPNDVGKVIGKRGVLADAIRTITDAIGGRLKRRYVIEVLEPQRRP